eukprot:scaffold266999_cov31-Tisochrysis_lutea.AAC.1
MGPSEESPGHVIYLLDSKRVIVAAKIRVWEDLFPGPKNEPRHVWFADEHDEPAVAKPDLATAAPVSAPVPVTAPLPAVRRSLEPTPPIPGRQAYGGL